MIAYIVRRLLLMIPTLFGIMLINFAIVQFAPGGPVERALATIQGHDVTAASRMGSGGQSDVVQLSGSNFNGSAQADSRYRGAYGVDPDLIKRLEKQFGFDKPAHERFFIMLKNYATFNFGNSFYQDRSVLQLMADKLPVSITLGLWTFLLTYSISIPLGIRKAIKDGSPFDVWSSLAVFIGYSIPSFLFAVLLIVLFAGGNYLDWFPLRGITSDNWDDLSTSGKVIDYFWHITLPITASVIGSFATITMLTKNSFLDEINKQYVLTARSKGLEEGRVMRGHVFRNAMLIVVSGIPANVIGIFFTGSMLIEIIFSLDGLGLLGFNSVINRDYPVVFGTLYIFTIIGLITNLLGDLMYVVMDPRIDFEARR